MIFLLFGSGLLFWATLYSQERKAALRPDS